MTGWQVGDLIVNVRTGRRRRIVRITPAGARGTRVSDGPTYHAQTIDERERAEPRGHVADIWSGSMSYPSSDYRKVDQ